MTHDDDRLEALLRQALHAEADEVRPAGDGLARIREGIARRRRRLSWLRPSVLALGTAAVVGVGGVGALVAQQDPAPHVAGPAAPGTTTAPAPSASTSGTPAPHVSPSGTNGTVPVPGVSVPSASGTESGGDLVDVTVPVYRVGETESGPRLYREFTAVRAEDRNGGEVDAAVTEAVGRTPADPDYETPWPAGSTVLSVEVAGDLATVDLSSDAAGTLTEDVAVQQLVWTATAADPHVRAVQVLVDGDPVGGRVSRAPQTDVLAPVWVIDPADGATVGRTFTVHGDASVFEATVSWQLLSGGQVVDQGSTTASEGGPGRGTWSTEITAGAPGAYVLRAYEASAEDGSARYVDSKRITVR